MKIKWKKSNKYKGLTTNEVAYLTGVSARKLRWWDKQGLVKPAINPNHKPYRTRRYTIQDLICIIMVRELRDKGLSLQKIRKSVEGVEAAGVEHPLAKLRVACLANSVFFKKDGKYIEPISGQIVIEEAIEEIRPKLEKKRRLAPVERAIGRANKHYQVKIRMF